MRIFAIRDRLIDYFDQPFLAHTTKQVMGAISTNLAQGEKIDWAQAPHHFELWQIGEVDEKGDIKPEKQLIATLDSLIRPSIRHAGHAGAATAEKTQERLPGETRGFNGPASAPPGSIPQSAQAAHD